IIELADQAGFVYNFDPVTWLKYEKFAELIVRECLNELCDQMDKHNINLSNLPVWYKSMEAVEKEFGVK
ncbi:MAG: hypothetical protein VW518_10020, partial [Burkholderiaceae bacterium]